MTHLNHNTSVHIKVVDYPGVRGVCNPDLSSAKDHSASQCVSLDRYNSEGKGVTRQDLFDFSEDLPYRECLCKSRTVLKETKISGPW